MMFTTTITPRFGELDGLRHINNTALPQWFELAREPLFDIFCPQRNLDEWNLIMVHTDYDYVAQVYYPGDVEIKTYIRKIGNSSFTTYHEAWQNGKLCSKGSAVMIHFNFEKQKAEPLPDNIRKQLEEHMLHK
jgi:acyl-CoA thioester hydrolase